MGVAVFDYAAWSVRYANLAATVSEPLAARLFGEAGLLLDNTDCSLVVDVPTRLTLLNMIVAHLAVLNANADAGTPVGRMSSASEGGVSVGFDYAGASASNAYWIQTAYGAAYWQATAQYRTMHYVPGVQPYLGVQAWPAGPQYGGPPGSFRWPG